MNNDSPEYMAQANNIIDHASFYTAYWDLYPHNPAYYSLRPPLYGLLVLITINLSTSVYVLLFFQSLLCIFVWLGLRRYLLHFIPGINQNRLHAFLSLALILNPVQLILCNNVFSDILFGFLLSFAFFSLLNFISRKEPKYFLYYTIFIALGLLTKPALVYYAWINIILGIFFYLRVQRSWILLVYPLLLPLIIFFICIINKNVTGYYHYSSSKTENLLSYNTTNFLNMKYGSDSGYSYKIELLKLSANQADFKQKMQFTDSACMHVLKQNIKGYTLFHLQGMVNFFLAPGREFILSYLSMKDSTPKNFLKELNLNGWNGIKNYIASQSIVLLLVNIMVTGWNVFLMLGLVVFAISKKVPFQLKLIALVLILYIAGVSSLALGAARYKTAIYPILIYCNAFILFKKK